MWELKCSSARTRKTKWVRNRAGLETLAHLFTIQILPNSELKIPRTRCRFPSEGTAPENNVGGALVPNTANVCLLWEQVPYFLGLENKNRGSDVPSQQVHFGTSQLHPLSLPPARAQGHTDGWLLPADWATAAFSGATSNFEITPTSLSLVKTPFLEGPSDQNSFSRRLGQSVTKLSSSKACELFQGLTFKFP